MVKNWMSENYEHLICMCSTIKSPEWNDIFHEVLINFMEKDEILLQKLIENDEADKYIKQMFYLNVISDTAPYKRKYKHNSISREEFKDVEIEATSDICFADFELLMWGIDAFFVDKHMYREYILKKIETPSYSIRKMSIDSMVPYSTLNIKFGNIRKQMEVELEKNKNDDDKKGND